MHDRRYLILISSLKIEGQNFDMGEDQTLFVGVQEPLDGIYLKTLFSLKVSKNNRQ